MTDVLEVVQEVTTPTIEQALNLPFDASMIDRVSRFGFEFEFFASDDDDEVTDDDVWSDDHSSCNCDECLRDRRTDAERERPHGEVSELIMLAHEAKMIRDPYRHAYHCQCDGCSHNRTDFLLTAQEDCSCGVEFVSHILDLSDFDDKATEIAGWVDLMQRWKDGGGWMPDGHVSNGNHVHVSSRGDIGAAFTTRERQLAYTHINALYAAFDWTDVADGGCGRIRGYNHKPNATYGGGSWLSDRGYGTFEHRLWNTPAKPGRLWAHIGLSVAITRWAFAITTALPDFTFWDQPTRGGGVSMSNERLEQLSRGFVIDSLAQYIPERREFDDARDIIRNLRPY